MSAGMALPIVTMSEAQAYVRIETGEEEAVLAGLIRTASALCEAFINQVVISRDFALDLPASGSWERLPVTPVRSMVAITVWDDQPVRLHGLADAVEAVVEAPGAVAGWQLVTMQLVRRRVVRDVAGPWAAAVDFRARMLAAN